MRVIVSEFGGVEVNRPIVLKIFDEASEIMFHRLIGSFSLSVGLRMEGSGDARVNVKATADLAPPPAVEGGPSVRDNR